MAGKSEIVFGAGHNESTRRRQPTDLLKIHVAAIHKVKNSRLQDQFVEPENVVLAGVGHMDTSGNWFAQIELCVDFHTRFGPAKIGPGKQRQRQVDGGRVQRINSVLQIETLVLPGIKSSHLADQFLGKILEQSPVALLVGFAQRRVRHRLAEPEMIQRFGHGIQTGHDVAQALPPCELGKHYADELRTRTKISHTRLGSVTRTQTLERLPTNVFEHLRGSVTAGIHRPAECAERPEYSNVSHPIAFVTSCS